MALGPALPGRMDVLGKMNREDGALGQASYCEEKFDFSLPRRECPTTFLCRNAWIGDATQSRKGSHGGAFLR